VKLGVNAICTDLTMPPTELAREVEARGLQSLFLPDHTHIPVGRETPYPGGGELRDDFRRFYDPFIGLTAAAAVTTHLELGTGVALVAQRHPIGLAKQIACLDQVSNGRLVLGVGFGWNQDEMRHHGVDPSRRRSFLREHVLAMKELWTQEVAEFHGEHVDFGPSWCWPKPVQQPHPPVLLGGAPGRSFFEHVVEWADGWMPIGAAGLKDSLVDLHRVAEERGRDPESIEISVFGALPRPRHLERYAEMGVRRVLLMLPPPEDGRFNSHRSGTRDEVLASLDEFAELVPQFDTRVATAGTA
jgi:probable F420-dependent oxidoreductase